MISRFRTLSLEAVTNSWHGDNYMYTFWKYWPSFELPRYRQCETQGVWRIVYKKESTDFVGTAV
jgi:hypothetical protein